MRDSFHFPHVERDFFLGTARMARVPIGRQTGRRRVDHSTAGVPTDEEVVSDIGTVLAAHLAFVMVVILALTAVGIS